MNPRPVIVGMCNPLGSDPRHALYPLPRGSAGNRLYELLRRRVPGASLCDYRDAFDRRNLLPGTRWVASSARAAGLALRTSLSGHGGKVLLLGSQVRDAVGVPVATAVGEWVHLDGDLFNLRYEPTTRWGHVPHPSGRNIWYNQEANRDAVAEVLAKMFREAEAGGFV